MEKATFGASRTMRRCDALRVANMRPPQHQSNVPCEDVRRSASVSITRTAGASVMRGSFGTGCLLIAALAVFSIGGCGGGGAKAPDGGKASDAGATDISSTTDARDVANPDTPLTTDGPSDSLGEPTASEPMDSDARQADRPPDDAASDLISVPVGPKIVTVTLPDAFVGKAYAQTLLATGGSPPIVWSLSAAPVDLSWLQLLGGGTLGGTPMSSVVPGKELTVQVIDRMGMSDSRTFVLTVVACVPNTSMPCLVVKDAACLVGVQACVGGVLQACSGGTGSTDAARCGPSCNACDASSDACVEGRCRCGTAAPCSGIRPSCCSANGASACVDTQTDVRFCGACNAPCDKDRANVVPTCTGGTCSYPCAPGWGRCPAGTNSRGCETNTNTDGANCGGCGNLCPPTVPHGVAASPVCVGGKCSLVCDPGWDNCDGNSGNGCEAPLNTISNCGACGTTCPPATGGGAQCGQGGRCEMTCPTGTFLCGTKCLPNENDDVNNCGACGHVCVVPANGVSVGCSGGRCTVQCAKGFGNCNSSFEDGCETNTDTSGAHCGGCNNACPGGWPLCLSGTCACFITFTGEYCSVGHRCDICGCDAGSSCI